MAYLTRTFYQKTILCVLAAALAFVGILWARPPKAAQAIEDLPKVAEADLTSGKINGRNWMSGISGEKYLNEINIPGTHDSAMKDPSPVGSAYGAALLLLKKAARTQDLTIPEQLNVGVRMFDLRLTATLTGKVSNPVDGKNTWLCHGPGAGRLGLTSATFYSVIPSGSIFKSDTIISLNMVMNYYADFLRQHPTETIIAEVTNESGTGDKTTIFNLMKAELTKWSNTINPSTGKPYVYLPNGADGSKVITTMPKLADTRGQIVVATDNTNLLGYGMGIGRGNDWSSTSSIAGMRFVYENHYEATNEDKVAYVNGIYNGGTVSGSTMTAQKGTVGAALSNPPLDYAISVFTASNRVTKLGWVPRSIADYVNPRIFTNDDATMNTRGVLYGWVSVDFVTEEIAKKIWLNNYPAEGLTYCDLTFSPGSGTGETHSYNVQAGTVVRLPENGYAAGDANPYLSFAGWKVGDKVYQPGDTIEIYADTTVTPSWVTTWSGLQGLIKSAKSDGSTEITLTSDVTAGTYDVELYVGTKVTINLNGHTIDKNCANGSLSCSVFCVDGSLTLNGPGTVTGGNAGRGGGIFVGEGATVALNGVTVRGNKAQRAAGGVFVSAGSGTTFSVSGETRVNGNFLSDGTTASNVLLEDGALIQGLDNLSEGASIGVSSAVAPTRSHPVVVSSELVDAASLGYLKNESSYSLGLSATSKCAQLSVPCLVTFNSVGGGSVATQTVPEGSMATEPKKPGKAGASFAGWFVAGTSQQFDFGNPVEHDIDLEAHWSTWKFTVAFDSAGGSEVPSQTVEFGKTATKPADPTREGYQFGFWKYGTGRSALEWIVYDFNTPVMQYKKLEAVWRPVSCTVTFDAGGGAPAPANQSLSYGEKATKPDDPTLEGHRFLGWYEGDKPYNFNAAVKTDVALVAKWEDTATYTVTFDANGGTFDGTETSATQEVKQGHLASAHDAPARDGYHFAGWCTDADGGTAYSFSTPVTDDVTLYASWVKDTANYEVVFNSQGGTAVASQQVEDGGTATKPSDPAREGHTFGGWCTEADCTNAYDFTKPVTNNLTLYAKWTPVTHSVTFDSDGGSGVDSQTIDYGSVATRPTDPAKEHYTFAGWYANDLLYDFDLPVTSDLALTAHWNRATYTVTFDTDGGSAVDAQTVDYGGFASPGSDPTKDSYTFGGWYADTGVSTKSTDSDWETMRAALLDTQNDPSLSSYLWVVGSDENGYDLRCLVDVTSMPIEKDITLYARWISSTHTVSYVANGDGVSDVPDSESVATGGTATEPTTRPTREHYRFGGWYINSACADEDLFHFDTPIANDLKLYAGWIPEEHFVTFEMNGGTHVDYQVVSYGNTASEPANPTNEGHTFKGWYADKDLTQAFDFSAPITQDTVVYAKWVANTYTVSFDADGGDPKPDAQTLEYGARVAKPSTDPTRDGYAFAGWYFQLTDEALSDDDANELRNDPEVSAYLWIADDNQARAAYDFDASAIAANITLYARWISNTCTVTFDVDGGSPQPDELSVARGAKATKPETDPTRDGYDFAGWYAQLDWTLDEETAEALASDPDLSDTYWVTDDNHLRVPFDFAADFIEENTTIYARWKARENTVTFVDDAGSTVAVQKVLSGKTPAELDGGSGGHGTFLGWYADADHTAPYDFTAPITGDVTVYGTWDTNLYTVTFDSNGGTAVTPKSQQVAYDEYASRPNDPKCEGYAFLGWYRDCSDEVSPDELEDYKASLASALSNEDPDLYAEAYDLLESDFTVVDGKVMMYYEPEFDSVTCSMVVQALWKQNKANEKAANGLTVKAVKREVLRKRVKTAKRTVARPMTVRKANGKVSYKKVSGSKFLTVNAKTGKVTVKKGTKLGTYKVKIKVTAAGNATHKAASKTVTCKVAVVRKLTNTLTTKAVVRRVKLAKVKQKDVVIARPVKVTRARGKLSFAKVSGSKRLTVNTKNGKVTVKKGAKKGTYKVKIKVTAKGNKNYKAGSKIVTCKVVVK